MRVFSRIALTLVAIFFVSGSSLYASHFQADCPLQLVASTAAPTPFAQSPHGAFRFGNLVFVLRGQALNTYSVNDVGDIQNTAPRQDFLGTLGGREASRSTTASFMSAATQAWRFSTCATRGRAAQRRR